MTEEKKAATEVVAFYTTRAVTDLLLVLKLEMLDIDRLLERDALLDGRLLEILAGAELTDDSGLFEFTFELLEGSLDVLAFLDGYYNHNALHLLFFRDGKGTTLF